MASKQQTVKRPQIGDVVEVIWRDAMAELSANKSELEHAAPQDKLITSYLYGVYYKVDDEATMILTDDSDTSVDYVVVPNSWIIEINVLRKKR